MWTVHTYTNIFGIISCKVEKARYNDICKGSNKSGGGISDTDKRIVIDETFKNLKSNMI